MAYGKIKADTLIYDNSGSDVEVTLSSLGNKAPLASPTFTGTVTIPTPAANDNTTKAASTAYVQTELGDYLTTALGAPKASPALTGTATGVNLTLSGNLTVNGTTTTINSTTLTVDDKNIELGTVDTPSDTTADGGGITLKGATDKTFNWVDATDAWTSSEHIHVGDNKKLLLGTGSDFKVWHNGSDNFLDTFWNLTIRKDDGAETLAKFSNGGSVDLYYDDSKKFETTAAGVTVTGTVTDSKGDLRSIPANSPSSNHVAAATDAGKCIYIAYDVTINPSVFAAGDAVTIVNNSGNDETIIQGSSFTLYNSADASTGNRTLAGRGMATIWFAAHNIGYISGAGLS